MDLTFTVYRDVLFKVILLFAFGEGKFAKTRD